MKCYILTCTIESISFSSPLPSLLPNRNALVAVQKGNKPKSSSNLIDRRRKRTGRMRAYHLCRRRRSLWRRCYGLKPRRRYWGRGVEDPRPDLAPTSANHQWPPVDCSIPRDGDDRSATIPARPIALLVVPNASSSSSRSSPGRGDSFSTPRNATWRRTDWTNVYNEHSDRRTFPKATPPPIAPPATQ